VSGRKVRGERASLIALELAPKPPPPELGQNPVDRMRRHAALRSTCLAVLSPYSAPLLLNLPSRRLEQRALSRLSSFSGFLILSSAVVDCSWADLTPPHDMLAAFTTGGAGCTGSSNPFSQLSQTVYASGAAQVRLANSSEEW